MVFLAALFFFVNQATQKPTIAAMVSGFPTMDSPVIGNGTNTEMKVQMNSGIMIGYSIDLIKAAIKTHPIGPLIK